MKNNIPLVILTGHRKSGTSLFHRLFDGVEDINLYPVDMSLLYAYFPCFVNNKLSNQELKLRLVYVFKESIKRLTKDNKGLFDIKNLVKIFHGEIKNIDYKDKIDVLNAVFNTWAKYQKQSVNDKIFVFKETSQAVHFNYYKSAFPNLKMISVIRDPRDNYAAIKAGFAKHYAKIGEKKIDSISSLINRARMDLLSARENQLNYPESFLTIKYEDLVLETEKTMKKVALFLGMNFNKNMLVPEVSGRGYTGNNWNGVKFSGICSDNIGAWSTRITESESKVIEYWMSDVMKYWQYECKFNSIDSQVEFSKFYELYNCEYFYHDSFSK
jgi:hypothetical protein